MKLKKLLAGVTAAAMAVGLVAVTPLMTSAAPDTSHITGDPYIIVDGHGRYYGLNLRKATTISEGTETYHFETTTAAYNDNFLETTDTEDGKQVIKSGELAVYFYDYGATLSDYEATLTIDGEVIATSTTAATDGSTWDYIAEANAAVGGRKSITLADKTTDVEMNEAKVEVDVTVTCIPAAPVGGTEWTKNNDNSYSFITVARPSEYGDNDPWGSGDICPGIIEIPYSDYLTSAQKSLVREVKIIAEVGQWQSAKGYAIINYLDADNNEATTYIEGNTEANWTAGQGSAETAIFETPNGVIGDSIEFQTWYMNYSTSVTVKFEFTLAETVELEKVTPTVTSPVTVYTSTAAEQAAEIEAASIVSIEDLTEGEDFEYTAVVTTAATESAASTAKVTVSLKGEAADKYELSESEFTVAVEYEERAAAVFHGYTVNSTEVEVTAAEGDTLDDLKTAITNKLKAQTITLKGAANQYPDRNCGKLVSLFDFEGLSSVKLESGTYTIAGTFDVYGLTGFDMTKDTYIPASKDITAGWTAGMSEATDTITFTVTVTVPEQPEEPTPEEPTPEEPTPVDPTPVDPTPSTPETPSTPVVVSATVNNRVGDGGSVSTDINTGAAFTGTRAMEEVSRAKAGDTINIVMTPGMSEGEIIAKIAYKKDVTVNLKYSAYSVSINSDDVAEDFVAKGFYSTARFLSADEKAAFAGAKELRQVSVKNLDGVEKATITVTMRGGSKGMDATALNRISAGKYKTVETGKVADDRTFSFEITRAGNYVVYAGKVNLDK